MALLMNVDKENPSEIEGTNVEIEGAGILDFELKGNTEQQTYTGKNLAIFKPPASTVSGLTITYDNITGKISVKGKSNTTAGIRISAKSDILIPNGTYTLSINSPLSSLVNYSVTDSQENNIAFRIPAGSTSVTNSLTNNGVLAQLFMSVENNVDYDLEFYLQLEPGSTATDYEPYVGGVPSPNPDYPQPIEVVTGDNTINVHGKNLCSSAEFYNANAIYMYFDTKKLAKTFTLSLKPNTTPSGTMTIYALVDGLNLGNIGTMTLTNGEVCTKTITISDSILKTINAGTSGFISIYRSNAGMDTSTSIDQPQIENNSSFTSYQPYTSTDYAVNIGNMELCKIGNYQDYIYKENNKWYKHSEIGKLNVDTSNITLRSNYTNIEYAEITKPNDFIGKDNYDDYNVYCSHAVSDIKNAIQYAWDSTYRIGKITNKANAGNFWLGFPKGTGLDNIKTTLNGTVIYYALATPTNTEITDTDLIEQLEEISSAGLYDEINYISLSSNNVIGEFKISYSTWYKFEKILRSGYNIKEDRDRITQKFANGHRKQFLSDYKDCIITLTLDTNDLKTTKKYLDQLVSGYYKYYSLDDKEYKKAQFIIEQKPDLTIESFTDTDANINEYQVTLLRAGD